MCDSRRRKTLCRQRDSSHSPHNMLSLPCVCECWCVPRFVCVSFFSLVSSSSSASCCSLCTLNHLLNAAFNSRPRVSQRCLTRIHMLAHIQLSIFLFVFTRNGLPGVLYSLQLERRSRYRWRPQSRTHTRTQSVHASNEHKFFFPNRFSLAKIYKKRCCLCFFFFSFFRWRRMVVGACVRFYFHWIAALL